MYILKNCYCRRRQLVSIEESWNLPMTADIPSRQQQNPHAQRNGTAQGFQKNYPTTQVSTSSYHSTNGTATHKTFKPENGKKSISSTCSYNLPQQHQLCNYFQQGVNILNCTNELGLMQHLQQQLRLQQNQQMNTNKTPTASEAPTPSNPSTSVNSAQNVSPIRNCDKSLLPNQLDRAKAMILPPKDNKKFDEDLKNIISQRNLATTITENFLRTFGSDDIDLKDSASTDSLGKFPLWQISSRALVIRKRDL